MKLHAISDLHVGYKVNRDALDELEARPEDWILLVGDLGETLEHLRIVFDAFRRRYAQVVWVPGNHELWTHPRCESKARGRARYQRLVGLCREHGVISPEDPYVRFPGTGDWLVPMFLGIDYTFGPDGMDRGQVMAWAREHGIVSTDERFWIPEPYGSLAEWSQARVAETRARIEAEIPQRASTILINHWPLRLDLIRLPERIWRFIPWCGTMATHDWHTRYNAKIVVNGHLHMRSTDWRDGVRFEEVALGYPRHWHQDKGIEHYIREIVPGRMAAPPSGEGGPNWHR